MNKKRIAVNAVIALAAGVFFEILHGKKVKRKTEKEI